MKSDLRILLSFFCFVCIDFTLASKAFSVECWLGTITDILTLEEGNGPGQVMYQEAEPVSLHVPSFDVDREGRFYICDPGNSRIQVFSSNGIFLRQIELRKAMDNSRFRGWYSDLAVDLESNIYLTDSAIPRARNNKSIGARDYYRILKFNSRGEFEEIIKLPSVKSKSGCGVSTDYYGILYVQVNQDSMRIYDKRSKLISAFGVTYRPYPPAEAQVVQRGDSLARIVFIKGDYVCLTSLDDIKKGTVMDSIPLPLKLKYSHADFIGIDNNLNIYFSINHRLTKPGGYPGVLKNEWHVTSLHRYWIWGSKLLESGQVWLNFTNDFTDNKREERATNFTKQYIVSGDGSVFFLHGTIDNLILSIVTFE